MRLLLVAFLALVVLAQPVQATLNGSHPFTADHGYTNGLGTSDRVVVVSGKLQADLAPAVGSSGFFNVTGVQLQGLDRACWGSNALDWECSPTTSGALSVRVLDGGAFGIAVPRQPSGHFYAAHALGLFVDFALDEDLNALLLSKTLLVPAVDGQMVYASLGRIEDAGGAIIDPDSSGKLAALNEGTVLEVHDGTQRIGRVEGKQRLVTFTGLPTLEPFGTDLAVLAFEEGSSALFGPASRAAAAQGIDFGRIERLTQELDAANQDSGSQAVQQEKGADLGIAPQLMTRILNGALLSVRTTNGTETQAQAEAAGGADISIARFDVLTVLALGDSLDWQGRAVLDIRDGHVQGAPKLVGSGWVVLPWWSYVLWALAIAGFIAVLVTKPPKEHAKWDQYDWIGRVAAVLAFILAFILWDLETRRIWGASLLASGGMAWGTRGVIALLQLAPIAFITFAVAAPLRLLLRTALRLAKQGRFMRLSGPASTLLGFLLGAHLIRAYLDLLLAQVLDKLG